MKSVVKFIHKTLYTKVAEYSEMQRKFKRKVTIRKLNEIKKNLVKFSLNLKYIHARRAETTLSQIMNWCEKFRRKIFFERIIESFSEIDLRYTFTLDWNAHFFTPDMTAEAIKTTKNSRSTCPDGISYLHLKHFSPHAIRALTNTFYHSLDTNSIPSIWEMGQKHPYPQHNKPPNETTTYRPIALLCSPSKLLES